MASSSFFNWTVRVKEESCDELLDENYYELINKTPDVKSIRISREYSAHRNCDKNDANKVEELQIEMECTDMKPNLLAVAKIEDYSPNQWPNSDEYETGSKIKLETVGTVKKEMLNEEVFVTAH
ncbi:uncharacterized protein LOC111693396 [Trichogramma pretiosum]|uniref:uncharacterized protein LOC111693396 n=1 Tax=Trichogramma pretiosum TaxID=7493 RepID=UPI000C71B1DF|nr:uncharacterized protein LOC111693396 [Trichogramma pretiosum]